MPVAVAVEVAVGGREGEGDCEASTNNALMSELSGWGDSELLMR